MDSPVSPLMREEASQLIGWHDNKLLTASRSLSPTNMFFNKKKARYGGMRKLRRRAVHKNGECNVAKSRISKRRLKFLQDTFTTFVDAQWRWTLLVFSLSYILSWLAFAVVWWLIAFTHGDFEESHLPDKQGDSGWKPCMSNIIDFASCFLYSIETQTTVGYGSRLTTEECPEAIFLFCIQSIFGVMMQAFMVGIVFAKMTRPKNRSQTLLFSKYAVICQRDGELCLLFRVGDMRKSHIIGASIRAHLIKTKMTREGECLLQYQTDLEVTADGCSSDFFFIWPLIICHKINSDSPLYTYSACDLLQDRFEIVVILEGTIESTGQSTQARSSYVTSEILWGHRFDPVINYSKDKRGYEIDYSKFNETTQVDTPLCSAKEWTEYYKEQEEYNRSVGFSIIQPTAIRKESIHIPCGEDHSSSSQLERNEEPKDDLYVDAKNDPDITRKRLSTCQM